MTDVTREQKEQAIQDGIDNAAAAAEETNAAVDEAAETAADTVEEAVEEAAETISDAVEEVNEAVQEAAESAAESTPGADPDKDLDDIADRVWNKLESRLDHLSAPAADVVEESGELADPILESTGDVARDVSRPVDEHWWFRPRRLPFSRKPRK